MGKGLTQKQEKFANLVAEGNSYSAAYRAAYDAENMLQKSVWEKASELMANVKVSSRVMQLQEMARERTLVTIESVTKELDQARDLALQTEQPAAMKGAIETKARLHGLFAKDNEQRSASLSEWLSERGG